MEQTKASFHYTIETVKDGVVIDTDKVFNLIPHEGLNYIINTALRNGVPFPDFYVGLYEGNYTPAPGDTMASFPLAATETSAYAEASRPTMELGVPLNGTATNVANKAEFTGVTNGRSAQGGFISSSPSKGSSSGVLVSAVRFTSPRPLDAGTVLRVTCGFSIVST